MLRYCSGVSSTTVRATGARRRVRWSWLVFPAVLSVSVALPGLARPGTAAAKAQGGRSGGSQANATSCPWTTAQDARRFRPVQLANQVLALMTLNEKIGMVELSTTPTFENVNTGVPRLCIPALTLQDGPNGLAYGDTGVVQLPASIATAATFDPGMANSYGQVLGAEAGAQGIDVVQAPNLNLARVPGAGRVFETFGEDPNLASTMAVAEIQGIQSQGVMAEAKHYTAYTQETARTTLNQSLPIRAFEEVYLAPFRAAVQSGHVAAVMCAYGQINGVYTCQNPVVLNVLKRQRGFTGFVRSDLGAVTDPVAAFDAGMDMIKPAPPNLAAAVTSGAIPISRLDDAVRRILTEMFAFGLVAHPPAGSVDTPVATPQQGVVALHDAEESIVLLRNQSAILPLRRASLGSLAVIGSDASTAPVTVGGGSAAVTAPYVITPLNAIQQALTSSTQLTYAPATSANASVTLFPPPNPPATTTLPPTTTTTTTIPVSPSDETATSPLSGPGWQDTSTTFTPPATSTYQVTLTTIGDSWLYVNGSLLLAESGLRGRWPTSTSLTLDGGQTYTFSLDDFVPTGPSTPTVTVQNVGDAISQAVAAASNAQVAIVFAHDSETEGADRQSLSLPGYQNALISAVAAANPRTVVVLNSGGAVLMPWISKVAAVLGAWYPGQEDGYALAPVLFGTVDPSGRLPVTFPVSDSATPIATASRWPGVDDIVSFDDGLDIGYRGYEAEHLPVLFPFGFGLTYTRFALSDLRATRSGNGEIATVKVKNEGAFKGIEVVEAYLAFPQRAAEPPRQLVAFARIHLRPGRSATATLRIPHAAFQAFLGSGWSAAKQTSSWRVVHGAYELLVGESSNNLPLRATLSAP